MNTKKNAECGDENPGKSINKITKFYLTVKDPKKKYRNSDGN